MRNLVRRLAICLLLSGGAALPGAQTPVLRIKAGEVAARGINPKYLSPEHLALTKFAVEEASKRGTLRRPLVAGRWPLFMRLREGEYGSNCRGRLRFPLRYCRPKIR